MNQYDVKLKDDGTLLEQPTDVFAAANGNGSTQNNLLTSYGTEYVFYALYQKPNGLSPERYLMIEDGTEQVEVSEDVFETWNKYKHIIPSPVFDIESSVTQNVTGQFEAWFFEPEDGFLGIVQLEADLAGTFPAAIEGDFARVVDTNTDWQYLSSVWTDSTTTIVGEESRVPSETYDIPIDPSINTGLPTIAPENTEIIISVLNGKLSKVDAVANYVNQDFSIYNTDTNITATYTIMMNDDSGNLKVVPIAEAIGDVSGAMLKAIYTPTADGLGYTNIVDAALKLWNGKADTTKCEILTNQDGSVTVNLGTGESFVVNGNVQMESMTLFDSGGNAVAVATYDGVDVVFAYGGKNVEMAKNLFTRVKATVQIEEGDVVQYAGSIGASGKIEGKPAVQAEVNVAPFLIVGVATEQITVGQEGECNFYGRVNTIDTANYAGTGGEGSILYYDSEGVTPGAMTYDKPVAPCVQVQMALVTVEHAVNGQLAIRPTFGSFLGDLHDVYLNSGKVDGATIVYNLVNDRYEQLHLRNNFADKELQNGQFKESFDLLYDIPTSTFILTKSASDPTFGTAPNELTMQFSTGEFTLALPKTFTPTFGTTTSLQSNWLYIPISTKLPAVATGFDITWANEEHIRIAFVSLLDEAYTDTEGAFINQNWNNHASGTDVLGALQHIRAWIRSRGAKYDDGVAGLGNNDILDDSTSSGTWYVKLSSGLVWQMHPHTFMAHDTENGDDIHVANYFGENYKQITTFNEFDTFSDGSSIGNVYFNVVMFGVANKGGQYSPLLANISTSGYNGEDDAILDVDNLSVYDIDRAFTKDSSTAFAIARITMRKVGSTYTYIATTDLRDANAIIGGGGGGGQDTEFFDTVFKILNTTDSTKKMLFDLALLTTGNSRTLQPQDKSYVIGDKADIDANLVLIDEINDKLDNSTIEQTYDELHESTFGAIDPIEGSPEFIEGLGLSLTQQVVDGDKTTSLTSDGTGTQFGIKLDGTWQFLNAYSVLEQTYNIISGNKYLIISNIPSGYENTNDLVKLIYSDATSQEVTTGVPRTNGFAIGVITANKSLLANIKMQESTVNSGLFENGYTMLIDITNTPLASHTASQLNNIISSYFEDTKSIVDLSVQSIGSNLFDFSIGVPSNLIDYYGLANEIYIKSTSTIGSYLFSFDVMPNTDYVISGTIDDIVSTNRIRIQTESAGFINQFTGADVTFNSGSNEVIVLNFSNLVAAGTFEAKFNNIQLEQGTVATTYAPYNSETISFPNTTLRSVSTIRDRIYQDNGVWKLEQNVEIDTTEVKNAISWGIASVLTNTHQFYKDLTTEIPAKGSTTIANASLVIGDEIYTWEFNDVTDNEKTFYIATNSNNIRIRMNKTTYATSGDFETYLQANDVTLTYELEDAVYTDIDKDGGLIQENPTTLIQEGLSTEVTIKFNLDSSAQIITNTKNIQDNSKQIGTVEDRLDIVEPIVSTHTDEIGVLANLTTVNKNDLVNAISEVNGLTATNTSKVGTLESKVTTLEGQSTLLYDSGFSVEIATSPTAFFTLSDSYKNYDAIELEILLTEDAGGVTESTHFRKIRYDVADDKIFHRFEMTRAMTTTSIINANFLLANVSGSEVNMNAYYGSKWTSTTSNTIGRTTDDDIVVSKVYGINYV